MNNNDLIFSGTKDVAENLKFDEARTPRVVWGSYS